MYQNLTLMQNLNDSKLAELRRRSGRSRPSSHVRREISQRIARPLARPVSH